MNHLKSIKIILVTSTRTYTDSTSVAAELAELIAKSGKRVLLIDTDFHRPLIHQLYKLSNQVGLADLLNGGKKPDFYIQHVSEPNLQVITCGHASQPPSELFSDMKFNHFLQSQSQSFDKIILHGPPCFQEETVILASQVDGVILMIQPGHAKSEISRAIIEKFKRKGANIIGIVMRDQPKHTQSQSTFIERLLTYDKQTRLSS